MLCVRDGHPPLLLQRKPETWAPSSDQHAGRERGEKSELVKVDIGGDGLVAAELWSNARTTCSIDIFVVNTGSGEALSPKEPTALFYYTPPLPLSRPHGQDFQKSALR